MKLSLITLVLLACTIVGAAQIKKDKVEKTKTLICVGKDKAFAKEQSKTPESDVLYLYAVKLFGEPTKCTAEPFNVKKDNKFGKVVFEFGDKGKYVAEWTPPETDEIYIESKSGFSDESAAINKAQEDFNKKGLEMTLDKPEVKNENGEETKTFWYPDEGMNARLFLVYKNKKLVRVGHGMAL